MKENLKINLVDLGLRIRQARTERNISQKALSQKTGISVPYISDIERGKKCVSVDKMLVIAQALQVSADWLLRLDLPQTEYAHSAEAATILADCSQEEAVLLLEILQSTKKILRKNKRETKEA